MFNESAHLYDIIYSEFKDYPGEAHRVAQLLEARCPGATELLDVGCGAGRHAALLTREHGYRVDGIDIEPAFAEIAGERCPEGRFVQADMADFDLDRTYDVVLCLFSSVGYVKTLEGLARAAACMRRHLKPDGLALIEAWFAPGDFPGGGLHLKTVDSGELKVARISRSEVRGRISWLEFEYLVGDAEGIRHLREVHELGLFTHGEMMAALRDGGFGGVEHQAAGLTDRPLYLARAG